MLIFPPQVEFAAVSRAYWERYKEECEMVWPIMRKHAMAEP